MNQAEVSTLEAGASMPSFNLSNVIGGTFSSENFKGQISVVAFICNHCPYVVGSISQINKVLRTYIEPTGTPVKSIKAVFISSNDPVQYPNDAPVKMVEFYNANHLCAPYLFDETQQIAKAFGAQCTPEFFVFNESGHLIYQGAFSDSPRDATKVSRVYLEEVLSAATSGKPITESSVRPMGCSIKWRQ